MSGYCISDTHVKIGSKIHTNKFYYLKRLFQNSFYSVRMGFIISRYINEVINNKRSADINKLTIVSYGLYSELLVSNIAKYLRKMNVSRSINHAIVYDTVNSYISSDGYIHKNIILIVPIASTLSTAAKLIEALISSNDFNLVTEPINVVVVGPDKIENIVDVNMNVIKEPASVFWKAIDYTNKFITTKLPEISQKYFIYITSEWYLPLDCPLCFPSENILQERPIFYTDAASVTPAITFGLPKCKQERNDLIRTICDSDKTITDKMVFHGHIKRGGNHYYHYLDTIRYYQHNIDIIIRWCNDVKELIQKEHNFKHDRKIFIIAPAHNTNSLFIDQVNTVMFNDTAIVYHFDNNEDDYNVNMYFKKTITDDSYTFFVDDSICTGKTFGKINMLITMSTGKGFYGIITLLNRLSVSVDESIFKLVDRKMYSLLNIEEEVMPETESQCYLCQDEKRYTDIYDASVIDFMKMMWIRNINDMKLTEILPSNIDLGMVVSGSSNHSHNKYKTGDQYLRWMQVHDMILHYITNNTYDNNLPTLITNNVPYDKFVSMLLGNNVTYNDKVTVFRVITSGTLIKFKYIKEAALYWLLQEIESNTLNISRKIAELAHIVSYDHITDSYNDIYENYRYLKFIIKSLCLIKSNYFTRKEVLVKLFKLHNDFKMLITSIDSSLTDYGTSKDSIALDQQSLYRPNYETNIATLQKFKTEIETFNLFFAKQIKSLIWDDEWKSVKLEHTLDELINDKSIQPINSSYRSLLRILRIENINPLKDLLDNICKSKHVLNASLQYESNEYHNDVELLKSILYKSKLLDTNRSLPVLALIGTYDDTQQSRYNANIFYGNEIFPLILLKVFLQRDNIIHESSEESRNKIKYILFLLCKLLGIENRSNDSEGAFFMHRYGSQLVNNKPQDELSITNSLGITPPGDDYDWLSCLSYKILKGDKVENEHYPWTNYELLRDGDQLISYSGKRTQSTDINEAQIFGNYSHFTFIRVSGDDECATGNGVFVFCTRRKSFLDDKLLRYVMLLRRDIYKFIDTNYNNEIYRAWIYEEKNRKNMLSMGHDFKTEIDQMNRIVREHIEDINVIKKVDIHYRLIRNKLKYVEMLNNVNCDVVKEHKVIKIDTMSLLYEMKQLALLVYEDTIEGNSYPNLMVEIKTDITNVHFDINILKDFIYEVILNSKKHVDTFKSHPTIKMHFECVNSKCYLIINDNGIGVEKWKLDKLNSIGYLKTYGGLHMMTLLWKQLFKCSLKYDSTYLQSFELIIPLGGHYEL